MAVEDLLESTCSLRCDVNVSLMEGDVNHPRVEIKNLNSIRHVRRAVDQEIGRQAALLRTGEAVLRETRKYFPEQDLSLPLRLKEQADDYRYFVEPDIGPIIVDDAWLDEIRSSMPVLPEEWRKRLCRDYGLAPQESDHLVRNPGMKKYFVKVCQHCKDYKNAYLWLLGPVQGYLKEHQMGIGNFPVPASLLAALVDRVAKGQVHSSSAKNELFPRLVRDSDQDIDALIDRLGIRQVDRSSDDGELGIAISQLIAEFPLQVKAYRNGRKQLLGMFMGKAVRSLPARHHPRKIRMKLKELLEKEVLH